VTDEMYDELMLFSVRRIDNPIATDTDLVESCQAAYEFLRRKIIEVI